MIIGIDPGVRGGMALLTDGGQVVETIPFKEMTERDLAASFSAWNSLAPNPSVWIEKVGYIRGDGAMGSFTFGAIFGLLRGLALGNGWEPRYVYPQLWQAALGCMTGGNKNVSKGKAIAIFPDYNAGRKRGITHDIADALLIAEYGRRIGERARTSRPGGLPPSP